MHAIGTRTGRNLVGRLLLGLLLFAGAVDAWAARLALVVGVDNYQHMPKLRSGISDARSIADALKRHDFEVAMHLDLDASALRKAVRDFSDRVQAGDEVVFYFSGSGAQIGGVSYMMAKDAAMDSEGRAREGGLEAQRVLDDLQARKARFTLAIFDACGDDPFDSKRAPSAQAQPGPGQVAVFSAGSGQVAIETLGPADNDVNSVFARVLLKKMREEGLPSASMLQSVRDEVAAMTATRRHTQVPAIYGDTGRMFVKGLARPQ